MKNSWESIDDFTMRLKVYRGWVVCAIRSNDITNILGSTDEVKSEFLVFVPDVKHNWKLEEK